MTLRRVAAFAQTLAIVSIILTPGLQPGGPTSARAAIAPADPAADVVFDATGNGIGCQAGSRKFKGPREPRDPPWPPGAEPTPTPSAIPSADPALVERRGCRPNRSPRLRPPCCSRARAVRVAQAEPSATPRSAARPRPRPIRPMPRRPRRASRSTSPASTSATTTRTSISARCVMPTSGSSSSRRPNPTTSSTRASISTSRQPGPQDWQRSGYHVFDYTLDGKAQADHFVDRLEVTGALDGTLPPVVDVECWSYRGTSTHVVCRGASA